MADKFILTGELQLRLGSTATVLKDLKTLSKDIIVGIDKAYFDKSVKYIKESLDSVPNIKVSVDKKILRESIKQASDLIKDKKFTIYGKLKLIDKDTSSEIRKLQSSLKTLVKIDDTGLYALDNLFRIIESLKLPYGITGLGSLAANISALSRVAKDHSKISKLTNALIPFLNLPFHNATNVGNMFNNLNTNIKSTSSLLANLATKNKAVAEGTREVGSEMEMLGRQAAATIRRFGAYTFATAIFFKLTGAIRSSLDEAIAFEKEVYKIVQVTKLSKTTIGDLVREVDRLSTSYGVSSSKILNSSLVIAQAGFSASETTKILESLAKTE